MKGLFRALVVGSVVCLGACRGAAPDLVETKQAPIFGGGLATTCQWPTTVLLGDMGCTGTLVHPLIVTTAAHCGTRGKFATFGETQNAPARRVAIEFCRAYQGENGPTGSDWAFCKLKTPVTDVPIVPVLMGCETAILTAGQKVVVAGFGDSTDRNTGFGTKRWVETTLNKPDKGDGIVQVGGMGHAPCYGDSGGPAYVRLADGSWRVFGIDSNGLGDSCAAGDEMALIHKAVPWIEKQSGIDITPCHDPDGKWNPSPACRDFSLTPDATGRAWENGCAEPTLSPPAATCGPMGSAGDGGSPADASRDARGRDGGGVEPAPDGAPPKSDALGGTGGSGPPLPDPTPADASLPRPRDAGGPRSSDAATAPPAPDAGASATEPDHPTTTPHSAQGACGCRVGGRPQPPEASAPLALLAIGLVVVARAARRKAPRSRA